MRAIIMAAGSGTRLADFNPDGRPKCLLEFGGKSLLARQLECLYKEGIGQSTIVVGYQADAIIEHVATLDSRPEVAYVFNPAYEKGSVLSLLAAHDVLRGQVPVLVLDADVLFHPDVLRILVESVHQNCTLIDHKTKPDDEPIGFFKLSGDMANHIADTCASYSADGWLDAAYKEALRYASPKHPLQFANEDISGLPWIAVDEPQDIERAIKDVLPNITKTVPDF